MKFVQQNCSSKKKKKKMFCFHRNEKLSVLAFPQQLHTVCVCPVPPGVDTHTSVSDGFEGRSLSTQAITSHYTVSCFPTEGVNLTADYIKPDQLSFQTITKTLERWRTEPHLDAVFVSSGCCGRSAGETEAADGVC